MSDPRISREEYKMALAFEVSTRSNCLGAKVGAILLQEDRIRAVGYNGTVAVFPNCFDGGCTRCADQPPSGVDLDRCTCVHAEQNALVSAARYGIEVEGSECYVTHEPCLSCTGLLIQAKVVGVVYLTSYEYPANPEHRASRKAMRDALAGKITFEPFIEVVPPERKDPAAVQMEVWAARYLDFKRRIERYAQGRGVIKQGPEAQASDLPREVPPS